MVQALRRAQPDRDVTLHVLDGCPGEHVGERTRILAAISHDLQTPITRLRLRALWNLIENGVKFGQSVEVSLDETLTAHLIRIRDHGAGLPESELEMVFEPFYRTEASRSRETGGTGLGLAIARNLLRAQGA